MRAVTGAAAAIVLAGGSGSRVGAAGNKVYLPLAGRPMLAWALRAVVGAPGVGPVLLVARAQDGALAARLLADYPEFARVELVVGGATRQDSELAGLRRLATRIDAGRVDVVLIHDGARPMAGPDLVAAVLRTAREVGGAIPALPRDDLAVAGPAGAGLVADGRVADGRVADGRVADGPVADGPVADGTAPVLTGLAPAGLVAVQTPQGFRAAPLLAAYERARELGFVGTDTASCVQRFAPELAIRAIPGDGHNFKVTHQHDVPVAERVLGARS